MFKNTLENSLRGLFSTKLILDRIANLSLPNDWSSILIMFHT